MLMLLLIDNRYVADPVDDPVDDDHDDDPVDDDVFMMIDICSLMINESIC